MRASLPSIALSCHFLILPPHLDSNLSLSDSDPPLLFSSPAGFSSLWLHFRDTIVISHPRPVPSFDDSDSYNATRTVSRPSRLESTQPPTHATLPACHHSHSAPRFLFDHLLASSFLILLLTWKLVIHRAVSSFSHCQPRQSPRYYHRQLFQPILTRLARSESPLRRSSLGHHSNLHQFTPARDQLNGSRATQGRRIVVQILKLEE